MFHLVEPDGNIRELMKAALELKGYQFSLFATPDAYLDYFNSREFAAPAVIITACLMPGKNCFELASMIRQKLPDQKLLVLSGSIARENSECLARYSCYWLGKPFRMESLFSLLEALSSCGMDCRYCNPARKENECKYGLQDHCPHYVAGIQAMS